MRPPISPALKVGELLEHYPELEPTLLSVSPGFAKLKNPLLRRTVARVATLEQAAAIGGVSVRDLVNTLRKAAGLGSLVELHVAPEPGAGCTASGCGVSQGVAACERPDWATSACTSAHFDADALLATNTHPLGILKRELSQGETGRVITLRSSFRPAPLLEEMRRTGIDVHCDENAPGQFVTYFRRTR